ncbi:MAG TPA: glycosyltransferase family 9 protein [Candidatus Limnocylindria bacterium]|nr:glycosyltransferase family 9 protein [Candidatus Limnocylindria bacterium]
MLCPFGSSSLRTLPAAVLIAGIKEFRKQLPLSLRLPAAPAERTRYEAYADELAAGGLPRPLVVPTPTVEALLTEMAGSRAVLSTESAPAHLAVALDRPAVILLGGGHHGLFAPWTRSARQIWLDHPLDCYHCDWQCCHPEPYCLTQISSSAVAEALLRVVTAG